MSGLNAVNNCVDEIIEDKVYLGDVRIFNDIECLKQYAFSHILTAEIVPVPMAVTSRFPHVAVLHVSNYF